MENISIVAEDEFEEREKAVGQMSKMQLWLYFQYRFNLDKPLHNLYPKAQLKRSNRHRRDQHRLLE